jgi:hypothetical protein
VVRACPVFWFHHSEPFAKRDRDSLGALRQ